MDERLPYDERFAARLDDWKAHPDVLGVGLHGSRGAGTWDENSDYDVLFLVTEDFLDAAEESLCSGKPLWDPWALTTRILGEMHDQPDHYSPTMLDVFVAFDRTGDFTRLLSAFGDLPPEKTRADAQRQYGVYLNGFGRSIKAYRKGDRLGAQLQAGVSMDALVRTLFGLNGRMAPYHDRLHRHWRHLVKTPCPTDALARRIEHILQTADPLEQARLHTEVVALLTAEGIPDDWPEVEQEKARIIAPPT